MAELKGGKAPRLAPLDYHAPAPRTQQPAWWLVAFFTALGLVVLAIAAFLFVWARSLAAR